MDKPQQMAAELWQNYFFLTREMLKFLNKEEYDLFFELMRQREVVQQALDQSSDDFKHTEQGRALLVEIREFNNSIMQKMQFFLNRAKQQQSVSQAYDGYRAAGPVGRRLDTIR